MLGGNSVYSDNAGNLFAATPNGLAPIMNGQTQANKSSLTGPNGGGLSFTPDTNGNAYGGGGANGGGGGPTGTNGDPSGWNSQTNSITGKVTSTDPTTGASVTYNRGDKTTTGADHVDANGNVVDANGKIVSAKDAGVKLGSTKQSEANGDWRAHITSQDECKVSDTIGQGNGQDYHCDGTRTMIDGAKVANQVTQAVGSIGTQVQGASAQNYATTQGTQAAALRAAASTQQFAATAQLVSGAVNALMGTVQITASNGHTKNMKTIGGASTGLTAQRNANQDTDGKINTDDGYVKAGSGNVAGQGAISAFKVNEDYNGNMTQVNQALQGTNNPLYNAQLLQRQKDDKTKQNSVTSTVRDISNVGASEQKKIASDAMNGGVLSAVTGVAQLGGGALNLIAANNLRKAANELAAAQTSTAPVLTAPTFSNPGADSFAPAQQQALSGAGPVPVASSSADNGTATNTGGGLGTPMNTTPKDGTIPAGATPGTPVADQPGGGGSGGAGFQAGGNTSPSTAGAEPEAQAKLADQRSSQGASYAGGGGGGGGNGGGSPTNSMGAALADMLAKALGQGKEEEKGNGIMDYGSRGLASDSPVSLLDSNTNIFERVHQTYQDKSKSGHVGL
jgi:hypothetical protein